MKSNKIPFLILSVFAVIGLLMLLGGTAFLIHGIQFKQSATEVTATITDIEAYRSGDGDMSHQVIVSYSFDGRDFSVPLNEYSNSMYEGKKITLLCDPKDPGHIMSNLGIYLAPSILLGMGIVFFLVGIIPTIINVKNNISDKKLLATGRVLHATVEEITVNIGYSVNGNHPYILYCTYRDDYLDRTYRFKSDNLWTNPEAVLAPGSYVDVYVNPNDYSRYQVDVESAVSGRIIDYT